MGTDVRFVARAREGSVVLRDRDALLAVAERRAESRAPLGCRACRSTTQTSTDAPTSRIAFRTVGSRAPSHVVGLDPIAGVTNYFLSSDPSMWRTNVPGYARVRYEGVYPGVDLLYHGSERGRLEYDFVVAPGADPAAIAVAVDGADSVSIDGGELVVATPSGVLRQHAPVVYQDGPDGRRAVAARFVETGDNRIGFDVSAYDRSLALVIDPEVVYSTYLGASAFPRALTVDASGAVYVVGDAGAGFPLKNAIQTSIHGTRDAFVRIGSQDCWPISRVSLSSRPTKRAQIARRSWRS